MRRVSPPRERSQVGLGLAVLVACVVVAAFDVWTVRSSGDPWKFGQEQRDYYNLLIDGWLDGHLHMKVDVHPTLLQLADPYDPKLRPPGVALHDASFFRGKYYLYFGAGPVVTLMLPFRLLTGTDLPQAVAVLVFTFGGFLASVGAWLSVRRRYFPESGAAVGLLATLVLGFAALGPMLLRRPHVWELPIAAGYCFAMLALFALWRALHAALPEKLAGTGTCPPTHSGRRARVIWCSAAGVFLGCAIASRPTYLVASPLLLPPLITWWRESRRLPWRELAAIVAPLAVIGAMMALHNHARFGDALQFGQAYQLSLDYESKVEHFSPRYVWFNAWRYFLSAAEWSRYYPFIAPAELPPKPPGFGGDDGVYGIFANLWIAGGAFLAPLAAWRRAGVEGRPLRAWLASAGILFGAVAALLLCFFGSIARYLLEFTPALMLLAAIGILVMERFVRPSRSATAQWLVRLIWGGAVVASVVFGILYSLQLNGLLRERNPAMDRAVARVVNQVPALFERLGGAAPGAWEADVRFPVNRRPGHGETLLSVGEWPHAGRIIVRYVDATWAQLGFVQGAMPPLMSEPVALSPGQTYRVRVVLGALLPPVTHPWFNDVNADDARRVTRLVRVEVNGRPIGQAYRRFEAGSGARLRVGARSLGDLAYPRFTGGIAHARWVPLAASELVALHIPDSLHGTGDTFSLRLVFPRGRTGEREPLVVTGATGKGDLLGVEYLADDRIRFFFDHWGAALLSSDPLRIEPEVMHDLVVRFSWLGAPPLERPEKRGMLSVAMDGRTVWAQDVVGYAAEPEEVAVGHNPIGGSHAGAEFSGRILRVERQPRK